MLKQANLKALFFVLVAQIFVFADPIITYACINGCGGHGGA